MMHGAAQTHLTKGLDGVEHFRNSNLDAALFRSGAQFRATLVRKAINHDVPFSKLKEIATKFKGDEDDQAAHFKNKLSDILVKDEDDTFGHNASMEEIQALIKFFKHTREESESVAATLPEDVEEGT